MNDQPMLRMGQGVQRPDLDPGKLYLELPTGGGTYVMPYLQTSRDLLLEALFGAAPQLDHVEAEVWLGAARIARTSMLKSRPAVAIPDLPAGDYELRLVYFDSDNRPFAGQALKGVGIGTAVAALGDSFTEGYYSQGYLCPAQLTADLFPPEAISPDGRNFPQFAPTAAQYYPEVNCFESWMTKLNPLLAASWGHPVFIANEGGRGDTVADFINTLTTDWNWQVRMALLRPQVWLIHLGVNDERAGTSAEDYESNLRQLVERLLQGYKAASHNILVAKPAYDPHPGAAELLEQYAERVDTLVGEYQLSSGPDFLQAWREAPAELKSSDGLHPNQEGYGRMAELWHQALVDALPRGPEIRNA